MNFGRSQCLCLSARLPRRRDRPSREITCFFTASNFGALDRNGGSYSQPSLYVDPKPAYIVSTLLSTETSYNDDVRRQEDERRSDAQKSKRIKTVKLAKKR